MEDRLLFINVGFGEQVRKIESTMTVEEAYKEIEDARKENRLAIIQKPKNIASLGEGLTVDNESVEYLNLNDVVIYSFIDNKFTPKKEEVKPKKTK